MQYTRPSLMLYLSTFFTLLSNDHSQTLGYNIHDRLQLFLRPITFTQGGVKRFFKHTFYQRLYTEQFLPNSFVHLLDFFDYAQTRETAQTYLNSVFLLFHDRLKECTYINPWALLSFIGDIERYSHYFSGQEAALKEAVQKEITAFLAEHNPEDPDYTALVDKIHALYKKDVQNLSYRVSRFIESALDKCIWHTQDTAAWACFVSLGNGIERCSAAGIIPETETSHLIWSLVYRFCYYLEQTSMQHSIDFYRAIKEDLNKNTYHWLYLEQDNCMLQVVERLKKALAEGEFKCRAELEGLYVPEY